MANAATKRGTLELFGLEGRIALVSGGSGIYGRHIVRGLAEAGAEVILASRDFKQCETYARELSVEGLRVHAAALDLTSEISIRALRDQILRQHRRLDVLVNNAVARAGGDLRHTSPEEWEEAMRVNSTGLFLASQIFSETMQEQRSGSIINIGSIYGMVGPDFSIYDGTAMSNPVNYAFAKAGMIGLTRYLAAFLAPYNVRVNCISPGGMRTEDTPPEFDTNYSRRTPMGRMAEADDIKGAIVFLASEAARYVTGHNLPVDGGWTAI